MAKTQKSKWTRETYDALYGWVQGPVAKQQCIDKLTRNGLADVVETLLSADNLGVWHQLTCDVAKALPASVVAASARQASAELDEICK